MEFRMVAVLCLILYCLSESINKREDFCVLKKSKAWRWKWRVKMVPNWHWWMMRKLCLDEIVDSAPTTAQFLVATYLSNSTIRTQMLVMLMLGFRLKWWGRTPFGCTTEKRFGSSESSRRVTCNPETVSASLPTHPSGTLSPSATSNLTLSLTLTKLTFRKSIPLKVSLPFLVLNILLLSGFISNVNLVGCLCCKFLYFFPVEGGVMPCVTLKHYSEYTESCWSIFVKENIFFNESLIFTKF